MCTPPAVGALKGPRPAGPPAALPAAPSRAGRPRPPARRRGAMATAPPPRGCPGAAVGARGAASAGIPSPLERGAAPLRREGRKGPPRSDPARPGPGGTPRRDRGCPPPPPPAAAGVDEAAQGSSSRGSVGWLPGPRGRGEEGAVRPLESGSCRTDHMEVAYGDQGTDGGVCGSSLFPSYRPA
ncbi:basic proline-rich protein-like isoform X2 [Aquila chrysaetos chrysaetos]|uniref:basic proline-rich protein-like isoform X2 n=1 Tax=Aquila chrysaetos chrysaetos TaxID=223781 RepID=UPI0011772B45|nr:basic proline-rich protein-like isoform X2 [Aquila chrysaetos chrysaetos]